MENETIFVDGLIFHKRKQTDQDFVLGRVAIKADELTAFIAKHKKEDGWLNIDFLKSREGKPYFKLNTWKPEKKDETVGPEDIPFN